MGCEESDIRVRSHLSSGKTWNNGSLREFDGAVLSDHTEIAKHLQKFNGRAALWGDNVKDEEVFRAVFTEKGAHRHSVPSSEDYQSSKIITVAEGGMF